MLVPVLIALESLAVGETCPAAVDVNARVRTILHLAPEQQLSESFLVERHEAGLYVVLRSADSAVIGERTLPLEGSCDELAQAAAVVLSAWLTDVHPDFAGALPPRTEPEPVTEPEPQVQPEPKPEPKAPAVVPRPPAQRPAPPSRTQYRFDAGLGVGGDLTSGALALAGLASAGYGPEADGLGIGMLAIVTSARAEGLGPGEVRWWRWPLGLGPSLRFSAPSMSLDLSAGPVAAWLHLEGVEFDRNNSEEVLTWGGYLAARVSTRHRPLAPFAHFSIQIYPTDAEAYVTNPDTAWPVPQVTLGLTLGARFSH